MPAPTHGIRTSQLPTASTVSPTDIVEIVQNGTSKKLPMSQLFLYVQDGASGFSGISGFSGFSGVNGEFAASGFSGMSGISGFSGFSGFSGISTVIKTPANQLIYRNELDEIVGTPNITSDGKTLNLFATDAPQVVINGERKDKSVQITVNDSESTLAFHSRPYHATFIGMNLPGEKSGDDLILSAMKYGEAVNEILRIVNSEMSIRLSRKLTATSSTPDNSGFNLPVGTAPKNPIDGDVWRESDGVYIQVGENRVGPLSGMNNTTNWIKNKLCISVNGENRILGNCTHSDIFTRRLGDSMECRIDLRQTTGIDGANGEYLIKIPNDLSLDENKINFMPANSLLSIGNGTLYNFTLNNISFQPRDAHHLGVLVNNSTWNSNNHNLSNTVFNMSGTFTIPIKEWN